MKTNTINLQYCVNLGQYNTMRIGAEFTPDEQQTFEDAMHEADEMLRNQIAAMCEQMRVEIPTCYNRKKPSQARKEVEQALEAADGTKLANAIDNVLTDLRNLNTIRATGEARELVTMEQPRKLNTIVKRMHGGVTVDKVFDHYRFDDDALALINAQYTNTPIEVDGLSKMYEALLNAARAGKDIAELLTLVRFDEKTMATWNLALNL